MSLTPETAPPEMLIKVFAELLSPQRFVFSSQDAPALYELIDNLHDEDEAIAAQIKTWCQERRKVFNSLTALTKRGPAESVPAAKPEDYKTLLKNKLRESFPEPTQKPPTSNQ